MKDSAAKPAISANVLLWAGCLVCQIKANQVSERSNIKVRPLEKSTKSEVLFFFVV